MEKCIKVKYINGFKHCNNVFLLWKCNEWWTQIKINICKKVKLKKCKHVVNVKDAKGKTHVNNVNMLEQKNNI